MGGGSKCGRCSAAVRGKAKEKVRLRVVPECIVPFHTEVRQSGRWEEGVSSGVFAVAARCYVSEVAGVSGGGTLLKAGGRFGGEGFGLVFLFSGNVPSSSVRISSCKLSGPSPASVCARTVRPYSVHLSRSSSRY